MNQPWAVELHLSSASSAGALRLRPGILACVAGEVLWLRGDAAADDLQTALRALAGRRYTVDARGRLTLIGERTPGAVLPDVRWLPLADLLALAPQTAALCGNPPPRVSVRLVRSGIERAANVLKTSLTMWADYAQIASTIRLRPLRFAADDTGSAIIHGSPLPPLLGDRYVETHGIAVPCGYEWHPRVDAAVLKSLMGLAEGDMAFLIVAEKTPETIVQLIPAASFVAATRSALRLTLQEPTR